MSNHVTEWLNAYLDGELKGTRLRQLEEPLPKCEVCQAELESLSSLSALLQEVPAAEFTSHERFVSEVNLRLPERRLKAVQNKTIEAGWWMIPIGLLAVWVFVSTSILLSNVVSVADTFGLLDNTTAAWISSPSDTAEVTSTLGQFGLLSGNSLQWAERSESFTRNALPQIIIQASIALLYLAWFAIWWARQTRQVQVPLLEG